MVTIGYRPLLWHLMRYYAYFGHREFILCLGYRADVIKEYFLNYREWVTNDFVITPGEGPRVQMLARDMDSWEVTFVDTGFSATVGERLRRVKPFVDDEAMFLANYADGLSDLPLDEYIADFDRTGKVAGFLSVRPSQSFHLVDVADDGMVDHITPIATADVWVNGGFHVLRPEIFDYLGPGEDLTAQPFQRLIADEELHAYRYDGFWMGLDTFKDHRRLVELHTNGVAPWEVWRPSRAGR